MSVVHVVVDAHATTLAIAFVRHVKYSTPPPTHARRRVLMPSTAVRMRRALAPQSRAHSCSLAGAAPTAIDLGAIWATWAVVSVWVARVPTLPTGVCVLLMCVFLCAMCE